MQFSCQPAGGAGGALFAPASGVEVLAAQESTHLDRPNPPEDVVLSRPNLASLGRPNPPEDVAHSRPSQAWATEFVRVALPLAQSIRLVASIPFHPGLAETVGHLRNLVGLVPPVVPLRLVVEVLQLRPPSALGRLQGTARWLPYFRQPRPRFRRDVAEQPGWP